MPRVSATSVHDLEREVRDYLPGLTMEYHDDRVRVGHAWPENVSGLDGLGLRDHTSYALGTWSRLFYETELKERETTESDDSETTTETVTEYSIELPPPSELFARFQRARDSTPCDLPQEGIDARVGPGVFAGFHERIEECKFRANRLSNERYDDLAPEHNPEGEYTTRDQTADVLEASATGRKDAHYEDFEAVVGLRYSTLFTGRHLLVSGQHDWTDASAKIARETVGVEDEHQCVECDALLPTVELLVVGSPWFCDECADTHRAPNAVDKARENRYEEYGGDLDREDYGEFGDKYHYSVRIVRSRPTEYNSRTEKQYFVMVEQGGDTVSWFATERDYLVEKLSDHLRRWSERRIIAGRLVGAVPLEPEMVHVEDMTDADLSATDVIPQAVLGDFDGKSVGKA